MFKALHRQSDWPRSPTAGRNAEGWWGAECDTAPRDQAGGRQSWWPAALSQEPSCPSIFFRALCISTAIHMAVFGGGAWIALTYPLGLGTGQGSVVRASLLDADESWTPRDGPAPD